ncbi:MAG: OmpH family outer membrane protein [Terracidiphilus sp.]
MKRTLALAALLGVGLVPAVQTMAHAQAPAVKAPAPPTKIAVIAFQLAVAQTNEGRQNFAALEKKYEPRQAAIKNLSDQVDTLTKQLQTDGPRLSGAERADRAKVIDGKKKQLDRDYQNARTDFQQDMGQVYNGLASKVYDVLSAYAKRQGYTLVLDISDQQTSPVLYASDTTNITKAVIEAYNAKSGVAAPAAQGAMPNAPAPAATH